MHQPPITRAAWSLPWNHAEHWNTGDKGIAQLHTDNLSLHASKPRQADCTPARPSQHLQHATASAGASISVQRTQIDITYTPCKQATTIETSIVSLDID